MLAGAKRRRRRFASLYFPLGPLSIGEPARVGDSRGFPLCEMPVATTARPPRCGIFVFPVLPLSKGGVRRVFAITSYVSRSSEKKSAAASTVTNGA